MFDEDFFDDNEDNGRLSVSLHSEHKVRIILVGEVSPAIYLNRQGCGDLIRHLSKLYQMVEVKDG